MISINLAKAKLIAHDKRRLKREQEFAPYDKIIALQIPGQQATAAEIERQKIRDKYAIIQTNIDNAQTADELLQVVRDL